MLRKIALLFLVISCSIGLRAQSDTSSAAPEYKKYHWDASPKLHQLSADESKMGIVVIKDKRIIEYYFETADNVVVYTTHHMIMRVNSDKGIEESNTVYIPMSDIISVPDVEARAIGKDGKVTVLDPKNIKDIANYNNLGPYKIFAIDGVEAGGEVEFLYTVKQPFRLISTEYIRLDVLYKDVAVDIYSPTNLVFETKSYNGFPDMKLDTTLATKRRVYMEAHDISGYNTEDFSAGDGALMRMEYKFTYNTSADPDKKLYTYNDFCQKLFELLDKSSTKKDKKTAASFIDTLKLDKLPNEDDKIRKIESRIKNLIATREDVEGDQYRSLPDIFKNHVCDEVGVLKLYHLAFDAAGIKHEIVLTTDRFNKPFDPDFESWTYLQKYLFYFPNTGQFMAPTDVLSRYGFPPANWICQKGLFIHGVSLGDYNTGVGEVKDIPCNDWKLSMNNIYADTKFDLDMGVANLHYKKTMTGYEAYDNFQTYYSYLSDEDKKDFVDKIFKQTFEDAKPSNVKVSGYQEQDLMRNPFVIEADFSTNSVLEKAGPKYLFKIGLLIGQQSELYRDTVRRTPIENRNNHGYHRELSFEIPDGYKVTNLDAANMDVYHEANGERTMEFHSYYKTEGNKVTVIIDEDYRQIRYPVSMYEQFRKVINASADFNKVVLILEKK